MKKSLTKDVLEIIGAFILALVIYHGLGIVMGTSVPIVSVASNSMVPRLHRGDLVVAVEPTDLKVGDIIIYRANCTYLPREDIIHRIVKIENNTYIIRGDNNPINDPCPVYYSQIKGKVLFAVPLLGWPRLGLNVLIGI